jgi:hypothetical protein
MVTNATAGRADVEKLAELIKDIEYAMLTTAMPDGSLRSRPMATQKAPFDGTLVKAVVTGKRYGPGENGKIDLDRAR